MNRLKGLSCYLSGPLDLAPDRGTGWRDSLTPFLKELGVVVHNPIELTEKCPPQDFGNLDDRVAWKESGEYDLLAQSSKRTRKLDLYHVDKCDFMVWYCDLSILTCGSWEELFVANRMKRPIIVWCRQGKAALYNWMFGMAPHQMFFQTILEVKDYLTYIDTHERIETHGRWFFAE